MIFLKISHNKYRKLGGVYHEKEERRYAEKSRALYHDAGGMDGADDCAMGKFRAEHRERTLYSG